MHNEEAAGTRCPGMEIEPEKIRPQYKVHKIITSGGGVKTIGQSGFRKQQF